MTAPLEKTLIPAHNTNYTIGRTAKIDYIVIHYTAGDGDTAKDNGYYFRRSDRDASAHFFVDEKEIVQSVGLTDTAWHAGNWKMNCRSIGIEMCSRKKGGKYYIPDATIALAQALTRELMAKYNIPVENVIRHYDVTGKKCPEPFVRDPAQWYAFRAGLIEQEQKQDGGNVMPDKNAPSPWAKDACEWAIKKGYFKGDDNGNYNWQAPLTREQFATLMYRMNGEA